MIASYPINVGYHLPFRLAFTELMQDPDFISSEEAKDFDVVLSAVRAARSLAASYNLQSNIQRELLYFDCGQYTDMVPAFVHSQTGKEIDLFRYDHFDQGMQCCERHRGCESPSRGMRVSRHKLHNNSPCVGQGMCVITSRCERDPNSFKVLL
jgi:hypothetical protein